MQGQLSQELDHYIDGINVTTLSAVSVVNQYKESGKAVRDGNIDVLTIDAEVGHFGPFSLSLSLSLKSQTRSKQIVNMHLPSPLPRTLTRP